MREPLRILGLFVVLGMIDVLIDLKVIATEPCLHSTIAFTKNRSTNKAEIETLESSKPSDLPYKYVGNNFSAKFHRPCCPFAKIMNGRHAVLFHFRKEAILAGHHPCRYCLPPVWKSVKASILNPDAKTSASVDAKVKK